MTLKCDFLVSEFASPFNLYRYTEKAAAEKDRADAAEKSGEESGGAAAAAKTALEAERDTLRAELDAANAKLDEEGGKLAVGGCTSVNQLVPAA